MPSYDDYLRYASRTGQFNRQQRADKTTSTTEDQARAKDPTISGNRGITSNYSKRSATYASNPNIAGAFDDDRDFLLDYNVVDRYREDWFTNFSRAGFVDPYNTTKRTKEYLFFTKPDLHIMDGNSINSDISNVSTFFPDAVSRYDGVVEQLQYSYSMNKGPLAPLLSNAVTSSLELPGISADYIETAKNVYQTSISYRGTSFKSDQDFEFSLDFKDSKFLDVYMYFKMYDEYERLKWLGQVSPKLEYIKNKILHDQFSIYKFIVAEDGMTLLYFARVTGVYPTSVPREAMSNIEGEVTYSVNFKGQFIYDMDPRILKDFNNITSDYRGGRNVGNLNLFNTSDKQFEGRWARCPVIYTRDNTYTASLKRNKYYLQWVI